MGLSSVEKYFECRITVKTETGHLLLNYFNWIMLGFVLKNSDIMLSELLWGVFLLSSYWPSAIGCIWCYFLFYLLVEEIFLERKPFKAFCDLIGFKRGKHSGQREFQMNRCKEWLDLKHQLEQRGGWILTPSVLPPLEAHNISVLESTSCCRHSGLQACLQRHLAWDASVRLSPLWNLHRRCSVWNEKKGYLA